MKKLFTSVLFVLLTVVMVAQQVAREMVVVEVATGTWCTYCPGAALGVEDMINNGLNVAVIEYHGGDNYENTAGNQRMSLYGVSGYPTAIFDGLAQVSGGDHTTSMYSSYLPKYNARKDILSNYTIEASGSVIGSEYTLDVTVNEVFAGNTNSKKLIMALTESDIEQSWQGQSELHFVERLMAPNASGTALDFSSTTSNDITLNFSTDIAWNVEHCEVVLLVQDQSNNEILQAIKFPLMDILPSIDRDCGIVSLNNIPTGTCQNSVSAEVNFANYGVDPITALEISADVNGTSFTESWSGNLAYLEQGVVVIELADFTLENSNNVTITVESVNGDTDENTSNDSSSATFGETTPEGYSPITFVLRTDYHPEETSWNLLNSAGEILYEEGDFTAANTSFVYEWVLPTDDCYEFNIFDTGNNGIVDGSGFFAFEDAHGESLMEGAGGAFQSIFSIPFTGFNNVGVAELSAENGRIFPNPSNGVFSLEITNSEIQTVTIYNVAGQLVYQNENLVQGVQSIDLSNCSPGNYIVMFRGATTTSHQQIIIK